MSTPILDFEGESQGTVGSQEELVRELFSSPGRDPPSPPQKGKSQARAMPRRIDWNRDSSEEEGEEDERRQAEAASVAFGGGGRTTQKRHLEMIQEEDEEGDGGLALFSDDRDLRGRRQKTSWEAVKGQVANIKRYDTEFEQLEQLGLGEFGVVFKCRNRME